MPTILDYVGQAASGHIHGQSVRPLVEGRQVPWRDYAFCQRADQSRMLRTEHYKYVLVRGGKKVALYDLRQDPDENHNVAQQPQRADAVRQMHRRLLEVMAKDGDPLRGKFPDKPTRCVRAQTGNGTRPSPCPLPAGEGTEIIFPAIARN